MSVVPVRGTQSFVHVMAEVFRRPSLTGLEVLWRWVFWSAVLAWPVWRLYPTLVVGLLGMPTSGVGSAAFGFLPREVWLPLRTGSAFASIGCMLLWVPLSALGRNLLLRRIEATLRPRMAVLAALGLFRSLWWLLAMVSWLGGMAWARIAFVQGPVARGGEAQWVGFCGCAIFGTLVLFVLWLGTSWGFGLASVYAGRGEDAGASLRSAWRKGPLRSKVAEINLVMGIVKIALIVLLLVFSASPLPFQSVETQGFLVTWTAGVLLLYFLASDYFHVVRLVAFVRMTEVFDPLPVEAAAPGSDTAS